VRLSDGKAIKCDLCAGLVGAGEELACVAACPTGARRAVSPEELARLRKQEEFVDVYRARMREAHQAAGEPPTYTIDPETCICCGRCARECPVDCISGKTGKVPAKATEEDREAGKVGEPFSIDQETCVHCGTCFEVCPVDGVQREQTPRDS
jgi:ferredoxin